MGESWLQIGGDPALRDWVFAQMRVQNEFDERLDEILERIDILMREHNVFHAKIHFSTGQVTLWLLNDPLRYRVHPKEDFLTRDARLGYPRAAYPQQALVAPDAIACVLAQFKRLRNLDAHIYLRSGSLNLVNGIVGLTFSCGGTHYLPYEDLAAGVNELDQ